MRSNTQKNPITIPITKPWLGLEEANAAKRAILSGWVTQGPEVAAFEKEFAISVGATYACAVSNCTTALHVALLDSGIKNNDEVITVSHSFIATANSIRYCGAIPVFVDIDPRTFTINPDRIEEAITDRTRAILAVHQMGMPCDMKKINKIAQNHGIPVIEDAACAIGSEIRCGRKWEHIGRPHGDIACFSFHPRKLLTTGDGGMLTTGRSDYDASSRLLRQHGMSISDSVRHSTREVIFESYPIFGYNYRMTDIQAAVGREQLKRLDSMIERRRYLAERYKHILGENPDIILPIEPQWARSNWQSYCIRVPEDCNQKVIMQYLLERGIATRRGIMCAHREKPYEGTCRFDLSESEKAQDHCILLPLFPQMTDDEQNYVAETLKSACSER
jgi:perosamine synthetase